MEPTKKRTRFETDKQRQERLAQRKTRILVHQVISRFYKSMTSVNSNVSQVLPRSTVEISIRVEYKENLDWIWDFILNYIPPLCKIRLQRTLSDTEIYYLASAFFYFFLTLTSNFQNEIRKKRSEVLLSQKKRLTKLGFMLPPGFELDEMLVNSFDVEAVRAESKKTIPKLKISL